MPLPSKRTRALLAAAALALLPTACAAPEDGGPVVRSLTVDAVLDGEGALHVTETVVQDVGAGSAPGLYREIPLAVNEHNLRYDVARIRDVEVSDPSGAPVRIIEQGEHRGRYSLLAGEPGSTATGEHTYVLSYTLEGLPEEGPEGTTLTWDFVQGSHDAPVESVQVSLTTPETVRADCRHDGSARFPTPCDTGERVDAGTHTFSHADLGAGRFLRVQAVVPAERVAPARTDTRWVPLPDWITWSGAGALAAALVVSFLLLSVHDRWERRRLAAHAGQGPPPGLSRALAGHLVEGALSARQLLAVLDDLLRSGAVTAHGGRPGEGALVFQRDPRVPPASPAQAGLLEAVFGAGPGPVGVDALAASLTGERVRGLREAFEHEGRNAGVYTSAARWWARSALALLPLAAALLVAFTLAGRLGWDLEPLAAAGVVVVGVAAWGMCLPSGRTRYGEHVKRLLEQGTDGEAADPVAPPLREEGFLARWNAQVGARVAPPSRRGREPRGGQARR